MGQKFLGVFPRVRSYLREHPGATAKEIGVRAVDMTLLEREDLITRTTQVRTGQRGRPANRWELTAKGENFDVQGVAA
jgi:predicted ArsR family transcriptional regulator